MTVNTTTTRTELQGNGTRTGYNASFTILADGDIDVYVAGVKKNLTSDYTVANAGTSTNAAVTFTSSSYPSPGTSLASSVSVLLVRTVALTQLSNYQNNDIFDAETLEQSLDKATQQIQQVSTGTVRALQFSDTVTGVTTTTTQITASASDRALKTIAFDADGNITVSGDLGSYKGTDATTTTAAYIPRDIVKSSTAAQLNNIYICKKASPIGTALTNTTYWDLIIDGKQVSDNAATSTTQAGLASDHRADAAKYAVNPEDSTFTLTATNSGTSGLYSALHYQAKAQDNANTATTKAGEASASATSAAASEVSARNSAAAVASALDSFDDKYLGTMSDLSAQGTNPTPTGTWAKDSSTISVSANTDIKVGQVVTGHSAIPSGTNVISIDGTSIVVSKNMTAASPSSAPTLTFTGYGVYGTYNSTKDGPTSDNDNGSLADGMLYFNTTDNQMMVYKTTGAKWIPASSTGSISLIVHKFTASGSETSVSAASFSPTLTYTPANIIVFLNGVRLDATDYTATNGNDITGLAALSASDEVVVYAFKSFEVADAVSAASGGTFSGNVTHSGTLTANGTINANSTIDMQGTELILDADADTSFHASTDDQIDIKIAGTDVGNFNSNTLKLVKDGNPILEIEDTAETAYSGSWLSAPTIDFRHNTSNADEHGVLGILKFKGTTKNDLGVPSYNDDISQIQGISIEGSSGVGQRITDVKGGFRFKGMDGAGGFNDLMTLNGKDLTVQGNVLKPNQPCFFAQRTSTWLGTSNIGTIVFEDVSSPGMNIGSHYSTSTGRFTAPVTGRYYFSWGMFKDNNSGTARATLRINGTGFMQGRMAEGDNYNNAYIGVTASLSSGDYAEIYSTDYKPWSGGSAGTNQPFFCGFLIG